MAKSIEQFVSDYVSANGRGCPKGVIQFVGGFTASDITNAQESGVIESSRGPQGGFFPAGAKPVPQDSTPNTLKSRMVAVLRTLVADSTFDTDTVNTLLAEYDAECVKRSEAKKNAKK